MNTKQTTVATIVRGGVDTGIAEKHFSSMNHPQAKHLASPPSIGRIKIRRMEAKNKRRVANGLPPVYDYRKV